MKCKEKWKRFLSFAVSGMMATACAAFPAGDLFGDANSPYQSLAVYAAEQKIESFSLSDVTMTDAYTVNAYSKEIKYLLSFDTGKLLAGFRDNAGLSTNGATRYGGWENSLIGGHTVGHYLTAIAQAYANPLTTSEQKDALYKNESMSAEFKGQAGLPLGSKHQKPQ